jgi:hypothetical protein
MRSFDAREVIRALALTTVPIAVALQEITGEDVRVLMEMHVRRINDVLKPKEIQL